MRAPRGSFSPREMSLALKLFAGRKFADPAGFLLYNRVDMANARRGLRGIGGDRQVSDRGLQPNSNRRFSFGLRWITIA